MKISKSVDLIARAGDRAAKVVRGLLDFARKEHYSFVPGNVNESILEALDLIGYQLQSAGIEVIHQIDSDLPNIVASWEHLKSVWLNLLLNARDALQEIHGDRRLEIVTRRGSTPNQIQVLNS